MAGGQILSRGGWRHHIQFPSYSLIEHYKNPLYTLLRKLYYKSEVKIKFVYESFDTNLCE